MTCRRLPGLVVGLAVAATAACGQYPGIHEGRARGEEVSGVLALSTHGERRGFDARTEIPPRVDGPAPAEGIASDRGNGTPVPLPGDGPLLVCPVVGRGYYTSSFGAYRAGPPVHPHQGNDMFAPVGSPIVAPFDGYAVATPNELGGRAVKVYGDQGYVYNAHLSDYGDLGPVRAGDVIGFVGASGNADGSAPHDHFEWHPDDGPAVDPFPLLNEVCPKSG